MPVTPTHLIALTDTRTVGCASCRASCCRMEVFLISDTGVPARYIHTDASGSQTMLRLDDGWCAALDRQAMNCSIYELRPWLCREFATASRECVAEYEPRRPSHPQPDE